jgi:hypothetical protein
MPKILINEEDKTLPGTTADYSNFAVLLVGFAGTPTNDALDADANGVYEFTSKSDFINTIGVHGPKITVQGDESAEEAYHYGNQMAYELLGMGYKVIYKPITSIEELSTETFWNVFKDKSNYDFRFISHGLLNHETINTANSCIANLAAYVATDVSGNPGRGDCVALIELNENSYLENAADKPEAQIADAISEMSDINELNGKYCAMTVPSVVYKMDDDKVKDFENNKKFPGAFHYLACFANSLGQGFAEWYAAAGYTRGVASYIIDHTTVKLGEIAINALEPRNKKDGLKFACNVIANFRGSYYLWGNRTAHPLKESDLVASHFLNIRQLCTTIKKQLYVACRRFTFDPNSDTLWINFVNAIKPTLERMKADQGIRDYRIQKVYTDKKATLKAKIRVIPIEAVEDFDIEVSLEDSFGETTINTTEAI